MVILSLMSMKKRHFSKEHRKHLSEAHKGIHISEEWKKNLSDSHKKAYSEGRCIPYWKGKHLSKKHKKKLSKALSGKNHPLYGRHHSDDSKRKMSESLKKGYSTGRIFPGFKGKHHTKKTKEIMRKRKVGLETKEIMRKRKV